jgi:hypothetical protein
MLSLNNSTKTMRCSKTKSSFNETGRTLHSSTVGKVEPEVQKIY